MSSRTPAKAWMSLSCLPYLKVQRQTTGERFAAHPVGGTCSKSVVGVYVRPLPAVVGTCSPIDTASNDTCHFEPVRVRARRMGFLLVKPRTYGT